MSRLIDLLSSNFLPTFLAGMSVNFEIAGIAFALGLALGILLAFARFHGGVAGMAANAVVGLMRAAPTFVVMFFLLNALPRDAGRSGVMIVAVSLVPYAAAYIADSGVDALRQLRTGSPLACFQILPNVARAFFVLVMASSAGAAIGVREGIAVLLRQAENMPSLGDMLLLFAIGVACFGIPLQAGFAIIRLIQRRLGHIALRNQEKVLTGGTVVPIEQCSNAVLPTPRIRYGSVIATGPSQPPSPVPDIVQGALAPKNSRLREQLPQRCRLCER